MIDSCSRSAARKRQPKMEDGGRERGGSRGNRGGQGGSRRSDRGGSEEQRARGHSRARAHMQLSRSTAPKPHDGNATPTGPKHSLTCAHRRSELTSRAKVREDGRCVTLRRRRREDEVKVFKEMMRKKRK